MIANLQGVVSERYTCPNKVYRDANSKTVSHVFKEMNLEMFEMILMSFINKVRTGGG